MSRSPIGSSVPVSSPSTACSRRARIAPRVWMPTTARPSELGFFSAISWAIRRSVRLRSSCWSTTFSLIFSTAFLASRDRVKGRAECSSRAGGSKVRAAPSRRTHFLRVRHSVPEPAARGSNRLPPSLVAMFALAGGLAVANIYYLQPLLDVIADEFGLSAAAAGILVAITQVGYLFGLLFLVPLGDMVERRGLICGCLVLAGLAAAICAAAPGVAVLAGALVALGVLSVAAEVMVTLVSTLASDEERGQALGTVMSGLVIGIIGARVVGGGISELIGWRSVYGLAAAAMLLMALMLRRALAPLPPPLADTGYGEALRSVGQLVREEPVLRQR